MTARACRNRQWWEADGPVGACRGAPPSVVVDIGGGEETVWPTTGPEDWCGAYRIAERMAGALIQEITL